MGWNKMLTRLSRILMNEADSSPGNGAPAAPAVSAEPTAVPTAPVLDVDALMSRLTGVIDEKLSAHQNAINAGLRKAGTFKQDKPVETPPTPTPSAPAVAQAGLSMADVEAMLQRDRVITRAATEHKLTDAQVKRMNSALKADAPDDISTWTATYLTDMGLVKAPTPAPAPAAPVQTPAQARPNISDRGAAAPTDTRDSEGVLNSRPLEMTAHDVDALILKHGEQKGLQMFQDRVNAALRGVKLRTR
jgi:uncharacterized protein (DUF4415 family)